MQDSFSAHPILMTNTVIYIFEIVYVVIFRKILVVVDFQNPAVFFIYY